jgi:type VI secretion system VgrG family protein
MPNQSQQRVYVNFTSDEFDNIASDLFQVTGFDGVEAISELFRFEIDLLSTDADIDLESLVGKHASLAITKDGEQRDFHGVIASLEQDAEAQFDHYCYKAVLVPRLWLMSLSKQNQIYQEKTVPEIVQQEILHGDFCGGILADDIDDRMAQTYPVREYTVQYRESDIDFISRLMENEGIYYYFEHLDGQDKLVFCDQNSKLDKVLDENIVSYVPKSGLASFDQQAIHRFKVKQAQVCKEIVLKDYNYREPHLPMVGTAETGDLGYGRKYAYGDHFKSTVEGNNLAHLRAQLELCKQRTCVGTSDALFFQAGKLIQVEDHYRASLNKEYLITRIRHMGGQALPGVSALGAGEAVDYQNEFDAIPSEIEFRPNLVTPKPKLYGFMSAIVDGALTSDRAQIDEHGRYKLIMPFDVSGSGDGKASRWVRKAEPFGGQGTGMSFPLLKGAEVIWSCMDGDLDRPIITGVVPGTGQGANKSVVTAQNSTDNVIKTPSGIVVQMRDGKGAPAPEDQEGTEKPHTRIPTNTVTSSHYMASEDKSVSLIQQQQHIVRSVFTSVPDTDADAGVAFNYQTSVVWPDDNVTFTLDATSRSLGISIDTTGLVSWPSPIAGPHIIKITVTKLSDTTKFSEQIFTLEVKTPDSVHFVSTPVLTGKTGEQYQYQAQALGGNGAITYALDATSLTNGLTINGDGLITWPAAGAAADYVVTITAADTVGANQTTDTQTFTLKVSDIPVEALQFVSPSSLTVKTHDAVQFQAEAEGGAGDIIYSLETPVPGLSIEPKTGFVTGTKDTADTYPVRIVATDSSVPPLTNTQSFTLTVIEDFVDVNNSNDPNQKSFSVEVPAYRTAEGGKNHNSFSRIGSFADEEFAMPYGNVYFREIGDVAVTTESAVYEKDDTGKVAELDKLTNTFEYASEGGHKIMDILNATRHTFGILDSQKDGAGLFEGSEPERFGLMEYTDGAKLMIHQNGCFDLAAGTSVTYDSLGKKDSLISVVLGGNEMLSSERFHYDDDDKEWITESWEKTKAYSFNKGRQENIFVGWSYDYHLGYQFSATVGASVEYSLAANSSITAGLNTNINLAASVNYAATYDINFTVGDSSDISSGSHEINAKDIILQYADPFASETAVKIAMAVAGTASVAIGAGVAIAGADAADNPGNVKGGAEILKAAARTSDVAAVASGLAGLVLAGLTRRANKIAAKSGLTPHIKVEKHKITLSAGLKGNQASIVLDGLTGAVEISGTSVEIKGLKEVLTSVPSSTIKLTPKLLDYTLGGGIDMMSMGDIKINAFKNALLKGLVSTKAE